LARIGGGIRRDGTQAGVARPDELSRQTTSLRMRKHDTNQRRIGRAMMMQANGWQGDDDVSERLIARYT